MSHGTITVTVVDASVVQQQLPMDTCFKRAFSRASRNTVWSARSNGA